ncbi:MAG TPA: hypothetical protein V6D46_04960 [Coleofasciculaceae cyanobacterium]
MTHRFLPLIKKGSFLAALGLASTVCVAVDRASATLPLVAQNPTQPTGKIAQLIGKLDIAQAPASENQLTEDQVRSRLDQLVLAIQNQNIDAIVGFYAPDATIEATVNMASGPQVIRLRGRQQIRDILELAYPQMQMTAVSYSDLAIAIAPDRQTATITCTLTQSAIARGQPLQSNAQQKLVFAIINNEILVIEDISKEMAQAPTNPSTK